MKIALKLMLILACLALAGSACAKKGQQAGKGSGGSANLIASTELAAGTTGTAFVKLTPAESGIDYVNKAEGPDMILDQLAAQAGMGTGDFDNDGDLDVFLSGIESPNRLYRNEGGFKFTDVTATSGEGLGGSGIHCGATFFDLEGDKDLDLYVCARSSANLCFINDGKGMFTEEAAARGIDSPFSTVCAAPFDYDNDGDLDLMLGNNRQGRNQGAMGDVENKILEAKYNKPTGEYTLLDPKLAETWYMDKAGKIRAKPDPNQLFENDGSGKFTDVSEAAGVFKSGWTLNVLPCDFNNDGFIDVHVPGDFDTSDKYYINNGDKTFTDKSEEMLRINSFFAMGSDAGDINGDGLMDLYVVDMAARDYKDGKKQSGDMNQFRYELIHYRPQQNMRNCLYLNRGEGWMSEIGTYAGVSATDWSWAARIVDLDSSGIPELFVTNGYITRNFEVDAQNVINSMRKAGKAEEEVSKFKLSFPPYVTDDVIFTAKEPLNYSAAEDNWGMHDNAVSFGTAVEDFDGDGDLDIITSCINQPTLVYRNDLPNANRVLIDLRQEGANPQAVGAQVYAHCGDKVFTQHVILSRGFASGASARVHLGLGEMKAIDKLEVRWPDGSVQTHDDLIANRHYTVTKGGGLPQWEKPQVAPLFTQKDMAWEQREADTVAMEFDNAKQPLLPVQRSMMGTGAGIADYNGDGKLDLYLAGPSGQAGRLFEGDGSGNFVSVPALSGLTKEVSEEMGVLWIDADGDSRTDLIITNGGMESGSGDAAYQDLLLLNKESGFTSVALPDGNASTGAACAADINHDGTLEVFLAGQMVPHAFAKAAPSRILALSGGTPANVTEQFAPQLGTPGPINDAQFVDVNNDGWQDLLLACEWSGVKLLTNTNGKLSAPQDIAPKGMWQSLGAGDFDNDGDIDLIAGNWSWNTKYHPKENAPMTLFADDFDRNGVRDLIEVKYGKDKMLPGRGRSCSGYAIGYIPDKWPTWEAFANASFEEVYGSPDQIAERFDAEELRNCVLVNDGTGKFTKAHLPVSAQLAPVFGIGVGDYNNDGNLDAFLANNYYGTQPEMHHWNTGYGVLLIGDGKGSFDGLDPHESGINIWVDGRSVIPADYNADGRLDLVVSVSNPIYPKDVDGDTKPDIFEGEGLGHPKLLTNTGTGGRGLAVTLAGKAPNVGAVGAKLSLELADGRKLTRIVQAGSGYLGSYSGPQHFGIPEGVEAVKLTVTWPDGTTSESTELSSAAVTVAWP